jgi:hypothetical protein
MQDQSRRDQPTSRTKREPLTVWQGYSGEELWTLRDELERREYLLGQHRDGWALAR